MTKNDPTAEVVEGWEPAQIAVGPGGEIQGELDATGKTMPPPPRLCEAGPCAHYHRFVIQLDAEVAKGASVDPGGQVTGDAPSPDFHKKTHHYCYPDVGIETELGGLPVLECNRWDPLGRAKTDRQLRQQAFLDSDAGRQYQADLVAWKRELEDRAAAEAAAQPDELELWLTMTMRDGDRLEIDQIQEIAPDNKIYDKLEWPDADEALAKVSVAYLREYGVGAYRLAVMRPSKADPTQHVCVATKIVTIAPAPEE